MWGGFSCCAEAQRGWSLAGGGRCTLSGWLRSASLFCIGAKRGLRCRPVLVPGAALPQVRGPVRGKSGVILPKTATKSAGYKDKSGQSGVYSTYPARSWKGGKTGERAELEHNREYPGLPPLSVCFSGQTGRATPDCRPGLPSEGHVIIRPETCPKADASHARLPRTLRASLAVPHLSVHR